MLCGAIPSFNTRGEIFAVKQGLIVSHNGFKLTLHDTHPNRVMRSLEKKFHALNSQIWIYNQLLPVKHKCIT